MASLSLSGEFIVPVERYSQVQHIIAWILCVKVKYDMVRKPSVVKSYICVFVSLTVKAVHLEAVTDLTSDAFITALHRFVT